MEVYNLLIIFQFLTEDKYDLVGSNVRSDKFSTKINAKKNIPFNDCLSVDFWHLFSESK